MFVGYQAAGTRGRLLVDGAKAVRMKGHDVAVSARIEKLDSMSAHADAGEILRWLSGFSRPPSMTYLVHGEGVALEALRARIQTELGAVFVELVDADEEGAVEVDRVAVGGQAR